MPNCSAERRGTQDPTGYVEDNDLLHKKTVLAKDMQKWKPFLHKAAKKRNVRGCWHLLLC